jgi:hypothetical protein
MQFQLKIWNVKNVKNEIWAKYVKENDMLW